MRCCIGQVHKEWFILLCILFHFAGRRTKDSNIHAFQFLDILHNGICTQFRRTVFSSGTAYYTGNFEIGSCLQGFEHIMPDITIANDGCSYFFHSFYEFIYQFSTLSAQK